MIIYPRQHAVVMKETGLQPQDVSLAPIQEQLENITRLGKIVKKIFSRQAEKENENTDKAAEQSPNEGWEDDVEKGKK